MGIVRRTPSKGTDMNPTGTPNQAPGRKRTATIGVAAGLLAGGAIGLVATMPSLTSAASDDGSAVVVMQEDTTSDDAAETPAERPEPGEHLRELLQPLVDDGTIDETQADAVAEYLVENRPEDPGRHGRPGRRGLDGHGPDHAVVADLLGIDRETLIDELRAGSSIADVAEANGIDVQTVIDGLIADAESHIDLAIDHGLDEEEAAQRLERITERITDGVYRTRGTDG